MSENKFTEKAVLLLFHLSKYLPDDMEENQAGSLLKMLVEFLEKFERDILDDVGP